MDKVNSIIREREREHGFYKHFICRVLFLIGLKLNLITLEIDAILPQWLCSQIYVTHLNTLAV